MHAATDHGRLSIADIVARQATWYPHRPAIATDTETWTYRDLAARVAWCSARLREQGVGRGDRVGTIFPHSPQFVPWLLALACAEAVVVPVNTRLAPPEAAAVLEHADIAKLLLHPELESWAAGVRPAFERIAAVVPAVTGVEEGRPPAPGTIDPETTLTLLYTSGSTGRPKGCALSHRSFVAASFNLFYAMRLGPDDRYLATMPLFHVGGLAFVLGCMHAGACSVFSGSADPAGMLAAIRRHGVTFTAVPFMRQFLDAAEADRAPLPTLRMVTWGSQMEQPETLRRIAPVLGAEWRGMFGSTECGNVGFLTTVADELEHPGTIGRPVPGLLASVRDVETGAPLGRGEVGELCVRGTSTMTGYWRDPEATAATIRDGWVRTGDLARYDGEGLLHFEGRAKDMIKSGGENVFAQEVEQALLAIRGVEAAAVFGAPDAKWGEAVVAAICVSADGDAPSRAALDAQLRERLAGYKVPKQIALVDALPEFQGKVQKRELLRRWTAGELTPC